jgi:hypothetical protein
MYDRSQKARKIAIQNGRDSVRELPHMQAE